MFFEERRQSVQLYKSSLRLRSPAGALRSARCLCLINLCDDFLQRWIRNSDIHNAARVSEVSEDFFNGCSMRVEAKLHAVLTHFDHLCAFYFEVLCNFIGITHFDK